MQVSAWWRSLSRAARFDVYIRLSFYSNFAAVPFLAGVGLAPDLGSAVWWVVALTSVHALVCALLVHSGVNHYLEREERPNRLIAIAGALTVAGAVAGVLACPQSPSGEQDGPANAILFLLVLAFAAAMATAVPLRVAGAVGAAGCAAMYALDSAQHAQNAVHPTIDLAILTVVVVLGYRGTLWMLGVVWELDRGRHVQASLAVAEERLRFARDLHDVVGRTLSVVAIKSELAAQLAKRGREQAVDEMLEVRQIAEDSLAELRAVVGAYRTADLHVELAGARSLLASAGIQCRVIGDASELPGHVQGIFGWVVREATTNVLRHSEAGRCIITVRPSGNGSVTLTMENDGVVGVDVGAGEASRVRFGSGLIGLAERIAGAGGTFTAQEQTPDWFRVTAQLSMSVAANGESRL